MTKSMLFVFDNNLNNGEDDEKQKKIFSEFKNKAELRICATWPQPDGSKEVEDFYDGLFTQESKEELYQAFKVFEKLRIKAMIPAGLAERLLKS